MKLNFTLLTLCVLTFSFNAQASCFTADDIRDNADVTLFAQASWVNKQSSIWQIEGQAPYAPNNFYGDFGVKFSSGCSLIDDKLELSFSLYGLAYAPVKQVGKFEEDNSRSRALLDLLSLTWNLSDNLHLEGGKLVPARGNFFMRSPADLLSSYYGGFKPTRLYEPSMRQIYPESFWGGRLSWNSLEYSLGLTVVPALAEINRRYESSGNWSANQRSNASESYLLSYTASGLEKHTPTVSLLLGDSRSVSVGDSYTYTPQLVLSAEMAYHASQQWRHFSPDKAAEVTAWAFPSSLYASEDKEGVELALGGQYTSDSFDIFGLEYYYQSEGYSKSEWQQQVDFVKSLNRSTGYAFLDRAFDSYKYLMAAEINNAANKGMLQGRHYIHAYASLLTAHGLKLQPYIMMNMVDGSAMPGIHFNMALEKINQQLEIYTGAYTALGSKDSEFALFGETFGTYVGFKYHL